MRLNQERRPAKRGFTLVELLVVIAIIGTLVALLLPAVQSARETARNNTCKNNVKQLQTALTLYDTSQRKLPGYVNDVLNTGGPKVQANGQLRDGRRVSWVLMVFPYIEQQPAWERWSTNFTPNNPDDLTLLTNPNTTAAAPEIEQMQCPSDPPEIIGAPVTSYAVNAGQAWTDASRGTTVAAVSSVPIGLNEEYLGNGVFFDNNTNPNINSSRADNREGKSFKASIGFVSAGDGTSKTVMVSENLHQVYYGYFGPNMNTLRDAKHHFGFVWHNEPATGNNNTANVQGCNNASIQRINGNNDDLSLEDDLTVMNECNAYPSQQPSGWRKHGVLRRAHHLCYRSAGQADLRPGDDLKPEEVEAIRRGRHGNDLRRPQVAAAGRLRLLRSHSLNKNKQGRRGVPRRPCFLAIG